jgi:hypothetical protein
MAALFDDLSRESARHAMSSLTRVERVVCGPLIRRQLDRGPRTDREIAKYGPVGAVRLCSARAIIVYMCPVGFIGIGLSFVGSAATGFAVSLPFVFLVLVLGIGAISRTASASVAGRRWRRSRPATSPASRRFDTQP